MGRTAAGLGAAGAAEATCAAAALAAAAEKGCVMAAAGFRASGAADVGRITFVAAASVRQIPDGSGSVAPGMPCCWLRSAPSLSGFRP